ncbi:tannase and feruloyl esterase [Macroventuria anomochaeta]|uniref:Tannase and feruloyl esterase n=1 Tax=Macroventuria anomochaeta TaxID=301207 RepID=A0ACB6S2L1_9PLEO|nr:tannase and feruloyl esterase [Macroventuria anomochaeta]KAF2628485.1 tannase and feruloyl esterase [Macroventuria anomochaeta]
MLDILPPVTNLNFCEVNIHLTHSGADDDVLVRVWLPLKLNDWNSRFQVTGGGGFATSMAFVGLAPAIQQGYAAVSTDGGHDEFSWTSLEWVLNPDRTINWDLWHNFMQRSVVEQILIGKNIVEQYYGERPRHSYWNGCSQGGRQGYMLAQKYPDLLDGIMAAAPALNLVSISMGGYWPQLVMKEADTYVSGCEFAYFTKKIMEACDMLDGIEDSVIMDPDGCKFDPGSLVGNEFVCDGQEVKVTASMADVVRKIRDGPRSPLGAQIWHGLTPGTNYATLANITITPGGVRSQGPIALPVLETLLLPPNFNLSSITPIDYFALWAQAAVEWSWTMATESTDLTALRDSGTKLLTWHGITDDVIPYQSTVEYRKRVQREMGGANEVDKFYRLFLAPGVGHCALGLGPLPTDPLAALVDWVERGNAPETIDAATVDSAGEAITRQLCKWPAKPEYMGIGDPKRSSSWTCVGGTKRSETVYDSDVLKALED